MVFDWKKIFDWKRVVFDWKKFFHWKRVVFDWKIIYDWKKSLIGKKWNSCSGNCSLDRTELHVSLHGIPDLPTAPAGDFSVLFLLNLLEIF